MRVRLLALAGMLVLQPIAARAELYYLIIGGIGGAPNYPERFADDTVKMEAAAVRTLGGKERIEVLGGDEATRDAVRTALGNLAKATTPSDRLAVFLVGHGSYDGTEYKFNLHGEDITGTELATYTATGAFDQSSEASTDRVRRVFV